MTLRASELQVGDCRDELLVHNLTRTQIVQYAGASGDFNPLHTDEIFATEAAGYRGAFAHGMLTMGITGRLITDWVGDGHLLRYGARFVTPVWPGDDLTARAEITAIHSTDDGPVAEFEIVTRNQDEQIVLTATATARLEP